MVLCNYQHLKKRLTRESRSWRFTRDIDHSQDCYWPEDLPRDFPNCRILTYGYESSVCCKSPVSASQSRTTLSYKVDASHRPSGENVIATTLLEWPSSVCCRAPVSASQSRTVQSDETDASCYRWLLGLRCCSLRSGLVLHRQFRHRLWSVGE